MDLIAMTKAAERTITSDLEYLIEKAVDTTRANYAVRAPGLQLQSVPGRALCSELATVPPQCTVRSA